MSKPDKVSIKLLPSGVPGLDEILGGGIPEFSFNLIAGGPGCGKTTMAHQFIFANATAEQPAIYFSVMGEPAVKMLRYQQQFSFFDETKIGRAIYFINLSQLLFESGLPAVIDQISHMISELNARFIIVDSFRTIMRNVADNALDFQLFTQRLALLLTSWHATTFLVGQYSEEETRTNPVFTVADGLFWLYQTAERNSIVRKLQITKLRGQASIPGLHTTRITHNGLEAFSRTLGLTSPKRLSPDRKRLSIGIPELDQMLGGGILEGDSVLLAGPSGTGKSQLATQFIAEGIRRGESTIVAVFEERRDEYARRAAALGVDFEGALRDQKIVLLYLRPMDLSVDEALREILEQVRRIDAKRLALDSLAGFEMALAPGFRSEFRESLYRMISALTGAGVTIISTVETEESFTGFPLSHYSFSFLTDDIIRLRYVEINGQLRKIMVVVKMRGSNHSKDIREYTITENGLVLIAPHSADYANLTSGLPSRVAQPFPAPSAPREQPSP